MDTRTLSDLAPMNHARSWHSCETSNGKVYVFGGRGQGSIQVSSIEMLTFANNEWTEFEEAGVQLNRSSVCEANVSLMIIYGGWQKTAEAGYSESKDIYQFNVKQGKIIKVAEA